MDRRLRSTSGNTIPCQDALQHLLSDRFSTRSTLNCRNSAGSSWYPQRQSFHQITQLGRWFGASRKRYWLAIGFQSAAVAFQVLCGCEINILTSPPIGRLVHEHIIGNMRSPLWELLLKALGINVKAQGNLRPSFFTSLPSR